MKMAIDYKSWKFTQKVIRIYHNRAVVKHFKSELDVRPGTGRDAIKASVLIRPNDSALVVLNKQILFTRISEENNVVSQPESWIIKSIGNNIPQLKIIYRVKGKTKAGNYDICIPHYNGSKSIKPPEYTKGNQPVTFNLKDRTKIVVNASSVEHGKSIIKYFLKFVNSKYIPENRDNFVIGTESKVKRERMNPIRGDYYPDGQVTPYPKWQIYF